MLHFGLEVGSRKIRSLAIFCGHYLTKLNGLMPGYRKAGFAFLAASMNASDLAARTVAEWDIGNIPIAHSLSEVDAQSWGLWISKSLKDAEPDSSANPEWSGSARTDVCI